MVGLGAIVATAGACVALSGIGDYAACGDTCDDAAPPPHDASIHDVKPPPEEATSHVDVTMPFEDVSMPPTPEASPSDAGPEDVSDAPMDAGDARPPDAGSDADAGKPPEAGPPAGPTCGTKGTTTHCTASESCCQTLTTQTNACSSSACTSGQGTLGCQVPADCPASKPICCGTMTLTGLAVPCGVTAFATTCASSCADNPPTSCTFNGTVRLCTKDSDCTSDPTAMSMCFNFQSAPVSWCQTAAGAAIGNGVPQH